jgi:hypothetical protein
MPNVGLLQVGLTHRLDQLRDSDQPRPHVRRQLGHFSVHRLVQRLDGPRHGCQLCQMRYERTIMRSRGSAQSVTIRLTTNLLVFTTTGNRSHGRPQTGIEPDSRPRLERTRSLTLPGVADAMAAAMRSTCLRLHVLVSAPGIEIVGRCDRPTECSATSHSHHDLRPITLLPIT